ncbi:MAG TPA: NAD-glutamate dehydrogenase [Candidatus Nanopelagicales bacterium]
MGVGFAEWHSWSSARDERLAGVFYRHVDPGDLEGRDSEAIVGAVTHLIAVASQRRPGEAIVRATNPTVRDDGWTVGRTVVNVVTDDMPFLVDSVSAELSRLGVGIHLVIHPIVAVVRDADGLLLHADPPAAAPDDASAATGTEGGPDAGPRPESWMHIEVDWQAQPERLAELETCVLGVLDDVRRAVQDWPRMVAEARQLATALAASPPAGVAGDEVQEAVDLLAWLADDHFTFLGYREYALTGAPQRPEGLALVADVDSGLGLLRSGRGESVSFADLPPAVRARALEPRLLIITKANRRSTVHRPVYLDYIGIKRFDAHGRVVGEHRFIGLLSASAYTTSVEEIPVVDRKVHRVRTALGFARGSHGGRDLMQFLETFPRDELFAIDTDELVAIAEAALNLKERRATKLFVRHDTYGRFLSCLVYLPRDRYTTDVRLRVQELLREAVGGASVDYTARVTESVLARLHIVVRMARGQSVPVDLDVDALEVRLADVVRSWDDHLAQALVASSSEARAHDVLARYPQGFPEAYRAVTSPAEALADLDELERLTPEAPLRVALQPAAPGSGQQANARLKLYSLADVSLAQVLPVLSSLGVQVVTEQPFRLVRTRDDGTPGGAFVFDFGLRASGSGRLGQVRGIWEQAFVACWEGLAEADGFNALVAEAGLDWRRIWVLRAYARYLRQAGSTFSQQYIEGAALANPRIASLLVQLFHVRFDPDLVGDRAGLERELVTTITRALDDVASLDQDRILRSFLGLIRATLRTNHFQPDRPALAVKLEPRRIRDLPEPRPSFEIWVQSPRVEGVHLRFGKVARGGLRWSDRREDFRTEILGLVKAQAVKNAVIVPVGAKGGFYAKQLPDAAAGRDAWLAEGVAAYKVFIGSLLDLTDNLVGAGVVPPERVVRHDEDDPYLVVAADKGTATFSDIANGVAAEYGFWLGDAFASGGSAGYDHKAMGITARGAWESVKAHFRVVGPDISSATFTCVGIGDMSGDVFGNGMLLSSTLKLVAAFDHRHIFLDPDPDPTLSFVERQRLFRLPRSSWADYSADLISAGGGVFPRSAKSIPVSPQVAAVLGIAAGGTMAPNDLLRAILTAPVDLLWNGGIGTYVKGSTESNAQVGDRANDAIRVDGNQLRARVVGEGGNLGLTQRGRIEAARCGVALNTDAIDNSAGVDTSDHEVNIKILLERMIAAGELERSARDPLLQSMTDEVAGMVLRDNIDQNTLLTFERHQGAAMLPAQARVIRALERTAGLDRELEALPGDAAIDVLAAEGEGLTRPELAVLVAYTKLDLKAALLESRLPDEPFAEPWLRHYFPTVLGERFAEHLAEHPLRRQIITTGLVNEMVNRGGISYALRVAEETGATPAEVGRAFAVSCGVFDLPELWRRIDAEEGRAPTTALNALRSEVQRLLDRATRWLLQTRGGTLDVPREIERFRGTVARRSGEVPSWLVGVERGRLQRRVADLAAQGVAEGLAVEVASLLDVFSLLDIVEVSRRTGEDPGVLGRLYFTISERYEVDRFLGRITALPRADRWSTLARAALRSDLYGALASLTARVARATPEGGEPADRVATWEERYAEGLGRARATLAEIGAQETFDLATLSVAMRVIRTLAQQGG